MCPTVAESAVCRRNRRGIISGRSEIDRTPVELALRVRGDLSFRKVSRGLSAPVMTPISKELPLIDVRLCTSCGDCLRICPAACLVISSRVPVVTEDAACLRCRACELICPAEAVGWVRSPF